MGKIKRQSKAIRKTESHSIELKKLGDRIRQLRIQKGYSNYENFAFEKDIPRAQFGRYERGEDLRYTSLLKVCQALDITIQEFFEEGFE